MATPTLTARIERWPIAGEFRISRGAKTEAVVVVAELREGGLLARGECTPYARYGETPDGVLAAIEAMAGGIANGLTRKALQTAMPPGAARNALDCAFWDLAAKRKGQRVWQVASLEAPRPVTTAYTLSLDSPGAMAAKAADCIQYPLLKLKLAGDSLDAVRLAAIRKARPKVRLIVDANEGFRAETLPALFGMCMTAGVEMIEQPLPQSDDAELAALQRPTPVCADESAHTASGVAALANRYDAVNIKLDKTGGLTEALAMKVEAQAAGLKIMIGCMIATSLAIAPAMLLTRGADWVDLDAPLLLAKDRQPGLLYDGSRVAAPEADLWG